MVNYKLGKIYKIVSSETDQIYIGSTAKPRLCQRMNQHRGDFKVWQNGKCNCTSSFHLFKEYGVDTCKIILIQKYPCDSKEELRAREQYHVDQNKDICVNLHKAYISADDRKKVKAENDKKYRDEHKKEITEHAKFFRAEHKKEIAEWNKKYYNSNKELILSKQKKYRDVNKDTIYKKAAKQKHCIYCDSSIRISDFARHCKTEKHKENVDFFDNVLD